MSLCVCARRSQNNGNHGAISCFGVTESPVLEAEGPSLVRRVPAALQGRSLSSELPVDTNCVFTKQK